MKINLTRILTVVFLASILWVAGCQTKQPGANDSATAGTTTFECGELSEVEIKNGISALIQEDEALRDQFKNVFLAFSDETLFVKGYIHGSENVAKFQNIIAGVSCAKNISYSFMAYDKAPEDTCSTGNCWCGSGCTSCPCKYRGLKSPAPDKKDPATNSNLPATNSNSPATNSNSPAKP